jgi:hypothetical protein
MRQIFSCTEQQSLRELFTWSQLTHENVLDMIGFTFDYGPFVAFVSKWQENGTATEFVQDKSQEVVRVIVSEIDYLFPWP